MAYPRDMSIADAIKQYGLPKSHRVHWSDARKADVVQAVHDRVISFHEARERYLLSRSEFEQWEQEYPPQALVRSKVGTVLERLVEDA